MTATSEAVSTVERYEAAALEIEKLAGTDLAEGEFFPRFLSQLVSAAEADAGAVWLLSANGLVNRICEVGFDALQLDRNRPATRLNVQYMLDAIQGGEAKIHDPAEAAGESPIDRPLLAAPILDSVALLGVDRPRPIDPKQCHQPNSRINQPAAATAAPQCVGVVELFLPADSPAAQRLATLQFVEEMCGSAARYLGWRQQVASPENRLQFWTGFEQLQAELHRSLDSARIAATAVNDGRHLLGCDRLSLAVRRGPATVIAAVSGQERVSQRSNAVRALADVASEVIAGRQAVTYSGTQRNVPPHLERPLHHYAEQSRARMIKLIPLTPFDVDRSDEQSQTPPPACGALIVEHFSDDWLTPLTAERADLLADHLAAALHNARTHESVFLLPLRRALGRCLGRLTGRRWATIGLVAALLAASVLALCFIPATYRAAGEGKLMPVIQRDVFAPWDGEVVTVHVVGGQSVEKDQILIELRNDDLTAQHVSVRNQLQSKAQHLSALQAALDAALRSATRKELIELQGRIAQARVEVDGLRERVEILRRQVDQQTVRSPIAGTVATFQPDQLLKHRPVRRGELLLEVMDKSGPWQLELEVPEHRVGHFTNRRATALAGSPDSDPAKAVPPFSDLPVEFVLATRPEARYRGLVYEVAGRTDLSADAGSAVKVLVKVDRDQIPDRRIGAEVRAKIDCGKSSLAYVLFGDVVEFVQKRVW